MIFILLIVVLECLAIYLHDLESCFFLNINYGNIKIGNIEVWI